MLLLLSLLLLSLLQGTSIYIVGMMGTGKSTVAKKLADGLRLYTYLDTDAIIEQVRVRVRMCVSIYVSVLL